MLSAQEMRARLDAIKARRQARKVIVLSEAAMRQKLLGLPYNPLPSGKSSGPTTNVLAMRLK